MNREEIRAKYTAEGRDTTTVYLMTQFAYEHLNEELKGFSQQCYDLAANMCDDLPDSLMLEEGLKDLLRAKDWFVRAALPVAGLL